MPKLLVILNGDDNGKIELESGTEEVYLLPIITTTTTTINCYLDHTCLGNVLQIGTGSTIYSHLVSYNNTFIHPAQTINLSGTISSISIVIDNRLGDPDFNMVMKIYSGTVAGSTFLPTGSLLGTSTNKIHSSCVNDGPYNGTPENFMFHFLFDGISVSGDSIYIIEYENVVLINNTNRVEFPNTLSSYVGGTGKYYITSWWTLSSDYFGSICY